MKQYSIFLIALLCIAIPLTASAATISLSKSSATMNSGGTTDFILTIDELPDGFTGYQMTATISNPSVAEISGVSFPEWASLSNTTTVPSSSVRISGLDISEAVEPGATNLVLGTITVKAKNTGTATLNFENLQVDDDTGGLVESTIGSASIIVQGSSSSGGGGGSSSGGGGGSSSSSSTTTTATTMATTKPTTAVSGTAAAVKSTTVQPSGTNVQSTLTEPTVGETSTAAAPIAAGTAGGSLPVPLIIGAVIAIAAAITLLYLAYTRKL